jgi:ribosome-binding factor A
MMAGRRADRRSDPPYRRVDRVNALLREVLAEELERSADGDERLRLVTVTGVEVDRDFSCATVFIGSLATEVQSALLEHRVALQRAIARQVRLKRTPMLSFVEDPAIREGDRIEQHLARLREQGR